MNFETELCPSCGGQIHHQIELGAHVCQSCGKATGLSTKYMAMCIFEMLSDISASPRGTLVFCSKGTPFSDGIFNGTEEDFERFIQSKLNFFKGDPQLLCPKASIHWARCHDEDIDLAVSIAFLPEASHGVDGVVMSIGKASDYLPHWRAA